MTDSPFGFFRVTVRAVAELGQNFRRFTLTGDDLRNFADNGYDQRIKLFFPLPELGHSPLPTGPGWYQEWRRLPDEQRNPIRTYTVRAVRAELAEVDVDIALHGRVGVASAWACDAAPGDELVLLGPDARWKGEHGGVDFVPPARTEAYLLAGDETALPAIAGILERLPHAAYGIAVVEVGHDSDAAALSPAPAGVDVRVCGRAGAARGSWLGTALPTAADELLAGSRRLDIELEDVDVDTDLLWEVPRDDEGHAARESTEVYAWLAGEAGVIRGLRRHLVSERGMDRKSVAFMGYWRHGKAENNG